MITINGSMGEGGGQILRTSLGLSLVTGQPFKINKIRAGRKKPGLLRQHLTAVKAATKIGRARVKGDYIGSQELVFEPNGVTPGDYTFQVGTAGSATLVFQAVLPALMTADKPSTLILEGGTHNPFAPPFDFLEKTFLPVINRMGPKITVSLEKYGFYPAGGGRFKVEIQPSDKLYPNELLQRGEVKNQKITAIVSMLSPSIAHREIKAIRAKTGWDEENFEAKEVTNSKGPGNVVFIEVQCEHITEVFTGFGERKASAESVANAALKQARQYLKSEAPVGRYLADQLLIPFALAKNGAFLTLPLSRHCSTNIEVLKMFLDVDVQVAEDQERLVEVTVSS